MVSPVPAMTEAIRSGVCAAYVPGYMAHYGGLPPDTVEFRDRAGGQDQVRGGGVLAQGRHRRGARGGVRASPGVRVPPRPLSALSVPFQGVNTSPSSRPTPC